MARQIYLFLAVAVSLLLLALLVTFPVMPVTGAPMAAPTPNAATERTNGLPQMYTFFNATTMTADTTSSCFELANYDVMDLYYNIDQGTVNTTTLTLKFGNTESALVSGINIVAANAADANNLQPFQVFGRYTCIYADVANTNTITITVNALAK